MRCVRHSVYGRPDDVLGLADRPYPRPRPGMLLVRVRMAPVHRGDLLSVEGSPAFGTRAAIPDGGRIPGLEGIGRAVLAGEESRLVPGDRVAFFPAPSTWAEVVAVPEAFAVRIPDYLPDEIAARVLIDVATAAVVVRRAIAAAPTGPVVQTGASSGVGRIISRLLQEAGLTAIRLVRSRESAAALHDVDDAAPVIATADDDWEDQLADAVARYHPAIAIDGVGGSLLGCVSRSVAEGGTIVNYGTLGGALADIRPIVPRRQTLVGVSVGEWPECDEAVRRADVATALRLANDTPEIFGQAKVFAAADIKGAVAAMGDPQRRSAVLLDFGED